MLALIPCDIATLATEAPATSHWAITRALISSLLRRLDAVLSFAIATT